MEQEQKILINRNWKFMHGDFPEAKTPEYDDREWYDIGIPHSFGIPYFMEKQFYIGYGCYRKWLQIETGFDTKKLYLEFQASFQDTEVYVNGELAGTHRGGYTAFLIDITSFVRPGANLIFVRVNNLWNPRIAPRGGEHVFNGGIYRDVSLIVKEKVHVAWYGTRVTTPEVSAERARIVAETEVENTSSVQADGRLESILLYKGEEAGRMESVFSIAPENMTTVVQEQFLADPQLWHPDTPNLYTMVSRVYVDDVPVDTYETEFGIRYFAFTADKGFFLNGEHYDIHGANVHQDQAGWSDAVTHTAIARDIAMVKDCGMNFIRGSHYPHHPYFAEECDRQGILFWSENCFWGTGGVKEEGYWTASGYPVNEEDEEEFEAGCMQTLSEMIRVNRNHPSIIVWSMCNEPFFSALEVLDKARALVRKLVEYSHVLDDSRPAAVGGAQRGGFDTLGDIAGYNGDGASIFLNPGFPNFVSEYGSSVLDRPGEFIHRYRDGVEEDYPWRSGKCLWCAFHHGSILGNMGHMGMIDYYRLPLDTWYWYRENLAGVPRPEIPKKGVPHRVRLTPSSLTMKCDGTEDVKIVAEVLNEAGERIDCNPQIELSVVSGPGRFPTGKNFILSSGKENLIQGLGAITLRAYDGGETVVHAVCEGLLCDEIRIQVIGEEVPEGCARVELQPPPYVCDEPKRRSLDNIAINRPVFCTSAEEEHPARNVTNGDMKAYWRPAEDDTERMVLVDLEGTKEIQSVVVVFAEVTNADYEILLTDDRKTYRSVYASEKANIDNFLTVSLPGEKTRYVCVRFPERAVGVYKVEVFA